MEEKEIQDQIKGPVEEERTEMEETREKIREEVEKELDNAKSSKASFIITIATLAIQHIAFLGMLDQLNVLGWVAFIMGIVGIILLLITYKDKNTKQKMPPAKVVAMTLLTVEMVLLGVPPIGSLGVVFVFMDAFGLFNKISRRKKK